MPPASRPCPDCVKDQFHELAGAAREREKRTDDLRSRMERVEAEHDVLRDCTKKSISKVHDRITAEVKEMDAKIEEARRAIIKITAYGTAALVILSLALQAAALAMR